MAKENGLGKVDVKTFTSENFRLQSGEILQS